MATRLELICRHAFQPNECVGFAVLVGEAPEERSALADWEIGVNIERRVGQGVQPAWLSLTGRGRSH